MNSSLNIAIAALISLGLIASIGVIVLAQIRKWDRATKTGAIIASAFEALALVLMLLSNQTSNQTNSEIAEKLDFISVNVTRVVDYVDTQSVDIALSTDDERLKELAYGDHSPIVFKDDIFWVGIKARKNGEKTWLCEVDAQVGDIVELQISYVNKTNEVKNDTMVRAILPNNMEYVPGSTILFNESHQDGVGIIDDTVTTTGINIGTYSPKGNAYVRFKCKVRNISLAEGLNQLVTWGTVTQNHVILNDSVNVYVEKD